MNKILAFIYLVIGLSIPTWGQIHVQWVSQAVVPGEKTFMLVIMTNGETIQPVSPWGQIEGASIRFAQRAYSAAWNSSSSRNSSYYLAFEVTADKPGEIIIPSMEFKGDNGKIYSIPQQKLKVYSYDKIQWKSIEQNYQYGVLWHVEDTSPFVNEPCKVELKFYVPRSIVQFQLPSIKPDGLATLRFEPQPLNLNLNPLQVCTALIRGYDWRVCSFHSALTPLRNGKVSISGTETMYEPDRSVNSILAQIAGNMIPISMEIPELTLNAKPLPSGAPAGFKNAVGRFSLSTTTQARDLSINEPISVQLKISGSGNLNTISAPEPVDASRWKLYPSNKLNNDETRSFHGEVVFQQLLRPTMETHEVPAFKLVYFDPSTEKYEILSTSPIPLPWKSVTPSQSSGINALPTVTPPPAGNVPIPQMTDIYGLIPLSVASTVDSPISPYWYLLIYIPFCLILGWLIVKQVKRLYAQSEESRKRMAEFKSISLKESSPVFLRSIGAFIEAYIPANSLDEQLKKILETRDATAFLPEDSQTDLPDSERKSMLKHVKAVISKLPILILACSLFGGSLPINAQEVPPESNLAVQLYEKGEFTKSLEAFGKAIELPQQEPWLLAMNYYGQGNCLYRLDKPGEAALAYRRALLVCPDLVEARKNLEFIQRKEGAVMPPKNHTSEWLTLVSNRTLTIVLILSSALMATSFLIMVTFQRYFIFWGLLCFIGFLLTIASVTNKILYPLVPESIPSSQLLIVTHATAIRNAADSESSSLMKLPSSTPLILQAQRGSWQYVKTFDGTPGWVQSNDVAPLTPMKPTPQS